MKRIECWKDLQPYGVEVLTGEACGLSFRILCDITLKGKKLLEKCLGLRDLGAAEAWNNGTKENPHIGSVLLAHDMLYIIGIFALLENGYTDVWLLKNKSIIGFMRDDPTKMRERYAEIHRDDLVRTFSYAGTAGDRNVHVMSGRIY